MEKETKKILERPFAPEDVTEDYDGFSMVKPHLVIRRLNEAFEQDGWQFVLEQMVGDDWSVTQFGKIGIKDGDGEWVWKSNCGTMARKFSSGKPRELENETSASRKALYKGVVSNCLKRCAMMLGIALDLYGDAEHSEESEDPATAAIANIQRGEEELCAALKCTEADLRSGFFKTDVPIENASAEERDGYLEHLRGARDVKRGSVVGVILKAESCLIQEKIVNEKTGVGTMRIQAGLLDGTLNYGLLKLIEYQARAEAYYDAQMKSKG